MRLVDLSKRLKQQHHVWKTTGDDSSTTIMKECIKNWKELSELPVKLVFRLCTNDQKVVNFYKRVSDELECVVLGNYWVEVRYDLHLPKMS